MILGMVFVSKSQQTLFDEELVGLLVDLREQKSKHQTIFGKCFGNEPMESSAALLLCSCSNGNSPRIVVLGSKRSNSGRNLVPTNVPVNEGFVWKRQSGVEFGVSSTVA